MERLPLQFIRWGAGLLVLGLLTGYGPLHHYLSGGVEVACPWAPTHGHVVLLGFVSLTLFGLVYRALPDWGAPGKPALWMGRIQLWLQVISVLGLYANGIFGYRYLDRLSPGFYYVGEMDTLRRWLSVDGWFLSLFAVGCLLFMVVLFTTARQPRR